jgi:geranylgeranyl reductase family protein
MSVDAIVVGAGPGGAAAGILLAERGLSVLVLDRARFPRPKVCGEYLSPEAARILDRLGVLKAVEATGAVPLGGMAITAPDGTRVTGRYPTSGPWRGYRDHALAIPRLVLDRVLADRLRETPADFRERHRVTDVLIEGDRVAGVTALDDAGGAHAWRAPLVIAADGRNSVVARRLGLVSAHPLRRIALMTDAAGADGLGDRGEIFVDPPAYCIVNPVAPGRANVGLVLPLAEAAAHRGGLDALFDARVRGLGHLAARFPALRRVTPVRALGPLAYRVAPPRHGGVLLVGDAAGFYDPFTGEGIFTALRSAELAAEVVARSDAALPVGARYERARRAAFGDKQRVTRALQVVIGRAWLANAAARVLVRRPALLDLLMGVLGDFVPPRALVAGPALRALGRR